MGAASDRRERQGLWARTSTAQVTLARDAPQRTRLPAERFNEGTRPLAPSAKARRGPTVVAERGTAPLLHAAKPGEASSPRSLRSAALRADSSRTPSAADQVASSPGRRNRIPTSRSRRGHPCCSRYNRAE